MLRLGEFEFEPESGQLSRNGKLRRLEPQPAKVLALLASRAGEVVSHEELRAHVWGEETHVDFERGLRYCIAQIRAALGDSAQEPRLIETLPKRGYRLRVVAPPSTDGQTHVLAVLAAKAPSARRWPWVVVALVLLALAAGWFWFDRAPAGRQITVAVVPFDNETGEAAHDGLARSFSDAVVAALVAGPSERLAVVGNAAALFVPREQRDLQALGKKLGAEYVVLGQVQRQEDRVRVIAHLIRVNDQKHLWADRFEPQGQDPLIFEASLGRRVADRVRHSLFPDLARP